MTFNRQGAVLNALMMASLVAVFAGPVQRFVGDWQPIYLVAASFLVALEASFVHSTFRRERMWTAELFRYLVPEIFVMIVLMRFVTSLGVGSESLFEQVQGWFYDPFSLFDSAFIVAILVGLLIGWLTHVAMQDFIELAPRQSELAGKPVEDIRTHILLGKERGQALERISGRFVGGGVVLLFCLALEVVNIEQIAGPSLALSPLSAGAALTYLVAGFLLYSQARLVLLQSRWIADGAAVADDIPRRWGQTSWLIIVGVVALALLLPRAYGLGFLDTLRGILGLAGYAFVFFGYLVIWLFSMLLFIPAWFLSLFGSENEAANPPREAFEPPPPPPEVVQEPQLIPAFVFWTCMVLLAGYALRVTLQRHPGLLRPFMHWGPLRRLMSWFSMIWGNTNLWLSQAIDVVQARLAPMPSTEPAPPRAWRLRNLAPRELVRYFYRSTLRRSSGQGISRQAGQTPHEFRAKLVKHLPEAEAEITELTEAFVEVEYSQHTVERAQARRLARPWAWVRRRLRRLNTATQSSEDTEIDK
ncbi:MAG: DUF4129 domain-containing protein [Chloroflexota bacterium]